MTINRIQLENRLDHFISRASLTVRKDLWYRKDIRDIKNKLRQCTVTPLTTAQKNDAISYWKKLFGKEIPTYWHEYFYSRNGMFSVLYVPTCIYHTEIIYRLNVRPLTMAYTDKNVYDNFFSDILRPQTIIRNTNGTFFDEKKNISREEALERCKNLRDVVIKPSLIGRWGTGVRIFSSTDGQISEEESIADIFNAYDKNFIIQKKVIQHDDMARLNPTSLNTLRVLSFRCNNEVHVLYAVVRIGRKNQMVDNETAGGINADVNLVDGQIKDCAYGTPAEKRILKTDIGTSLKDFQIPNFEKVMLRVKELHSRLPYFSLIGWDFGIDKDGEPVMIEWNRAPDLSQTAHGPAFGEMTEDIVKYANSLPDTFAIRLWSGY